MTRKILSVVLATGFLGVVFFADPAYSDYIYRIRLKNGGTISVSQYELKGENIIVYKYGGLLSFSRSEVAKIDKVFIDDGVNLTAVSAPPVQNKESGPSTQSGSQSRSQKGAAPKETQATKQDDCKQKLERFKTDVKIYCGQLIQIQKSKAAVTPATMAATIWANQSCRYSRDMVAQYEKQCGP